MTSLIPRAQFLSEPDDDLYNLPWVPLEPRQQPVKDVSQLAMKMPDDLCGLTDPTVEQQIAVLRYLALRLARVLYVVEWPEGLAWYQSFYEDTTLSDDLEVVTAVLAALNATVVSTSSDGEITIDFYPVIDEFEEFIYDRFIPITHYLRSANPDEEEDFEYEFNDAFIGREALEKIYAFIFFFRTHRIIDVDRIIAMDEDDSSENSVVAVNKTGVSPLQPTRSFDKPLDKIMLTIIGVIQFFKYSSEYGQLFAGIRYEEIDVEQLRKEMLEYIEEFPNEVEAAEETFEAESHGHMYDFEFMAESAIFHDLGITSIAESEDGWLRATMSPPKDQGDRLNKLGFYLEAEDIDDPLAEEEPVGLVRLGFYEWYFFMPSDDDDGDASD
jgi:hypothetical protein